MTPEAENFAQILLNFGIKTLRRGVSLHDIYEICSIYSSCRDALALGLQFGWTCSRGYEVMGDLNLKELGFPKFSALASGETTSNSKRFKGARTLEVLHHLAEVGGSRTLPAAGMAKNDVSFLFVGLFVTLLNGRACAQLRTISP